MVEQIGGLLTTVGLLVSAGGYVIEHRGRALGEVLPSAVTHVWRGLHAGVAQGIQRVMPWVRRRLGRTRGVRVHVPAADAVALTDAVTVEAWHGISPDDPIDRKVEQTMANVEELKRRLAMYRDHLSSAVERLDDRVGLEVAAIRQELAGQRESDREVATSAMRWQVRGWIIAFVGALLGIFG